MIYQPMKVREAEPPKPIYLNPRMDIMRIHNCILESISSLSDIKESIVDIESVKRKSRKRKMVEEL